MRVTIVHETIYRFVKRLVVGDGEVRGQMPAGREADHAKTIGVDLELGGACADQAADRRTLRSSGLGPSGSLNRRLPEPASISSGSPVPRSSPVARALP